ncbi:GTP 3',8-cyclase MoaA [Bacillaceae bacterium S4-13-56]
MTNHDSSVVDRLNRPLKDLRISVIDQCNFRCTYCMPAEIFGDDYRFLPAKELLSFDEIVRLAEIFSKLGVEKIRLTGGEPLLRKNLSELISKLYEIEGIKDIALTTNGIFLPKYANELKAAGLSRVNVSLDAIEDEVFQSINGRGVKTSPVLKGIEAAQKAGLKVKVNMVVKKGLNEDQVVPMAKYFRDKDIVLRYIEFMDVGNSNGWNLESVVTKKEIIDMISKEIPLEPTDPNYFGEVASRYRYQDGKGEIGVISSVTDAFCGSCTRARLSADGKIYTCLFASDGYDVRHLMREGANDHMITLEMIKLWTKRNDRYSEDRANSKPIKKKKIEMSYIGG